MRPIKKLTIIEVSFLYSLLILHHDLSGAAIGTALDAEAVGLIQFPTLQVVIGLRAINVVILHILNGCAAFVNREDNGV